MGTIMIPRYAIIKRKKIQDHRTICIFDSLVILEDSKIEEFEGSTFFGTSFKKLQIPPKLKSFSNWWYCVKGLVDIKISPKNKLFSYLDNKYLLGKSNEDNNIFDNLLYARYDLEKAIIPSQIEFLGTYAFNGHPNLTSVTFPKDSKLKRIGTSPFYQSPISKLVLPKTLEFISKNAFDQTPNLFEIKISKNNPFFFFSVINNNLTVKKVTNHAKT